MKRHLTFALAAVLAAAAHAQGSLTASLYIPASGDAEAMVAELAKKGFTETSGGKMEGMVDSKPYTAEIERTGGIPSSVILMEKDGTADAVLALAKYNAMVGFYKNSTDFTELEGNTVVQAGGSEACENRIMADGCHAEFFKVSRPQQYEQRVRFSVTRTRDSYRLVWSCCKEEAPDFLR